MAVGRGFRPRTARTIAIGLIIVLSFVTVSDSWLTSRNILTSPGHRQFFVLQSSSHGKSQEREDYINQNKIELNESSVQIQKVRIGDDSSARLIGCLYKLVPIATALTVIFPKPAFAASSLERSFFAYGHFLSMILIVATIVTERLTVKANMTESEEMRLGYTDIALGVAALGVLATGWARIGIEKGYLYYASQPAFWAKLCIVGYDLGLSLFVTIVVIQRTITIQLARKDDGATKKLEPMSEKLADRIRQVTQAHLTALVFMPLMATCMARGVGSGGPWSESVPVLGPTIASMVTLWATIKYSKEAIQWDEESFIAEEMEG